MQQEINPPSKLIKTNQPLPPSSYFTYLNSLVFCMKRTLLTSFVIILNNAINYGIIKNDSKWGINKNVTPLQGMNKFKMESNNVTLLN